MGFVYGKAPRWGAILKIRGSKLEDICGYWPTYFKHLIGYVKLFPF
jgi:hypothetical protein